MSEIKHILDIYRDEHGRYGTREEKNYLAACTELADLCDKKDRYFAALEKIRAKEDAQVLWDVARTMCDIAKAALK